MDPEAQGGAHTATGDGGVVQFHTGEEANGLIKYVNMIDQVLMDIDAVARGESSNVDEDLDDIFRTLEAMDELDAQEARCARDDAATCVQEHPFVQEMQSSSPAEVDDEPTRSQVKLTADQVGSVVGAEAPYPVAASRDDGKVAAAGDSDKEKKRNRSRSRSTGAEEKAATAKEQEKAATAVGTRRLYCKTKPSKVVAEPTPTFAETWMTV